MSENNLIRNGKHETLRSETSRSLLDFLPALELRRRGHDDVVAPIRVRRVLKRLGLWPRLTSCPIVLVVGTNGKGSTASALETLLRASGTRTGLFTSPHLVSARERIRISGAPISDNELAHHWVTLSADPEGADLSFFEAFTCLACLHFFAGPDPVDCAIFEAGVGGLWDATNALPHSLVLLARLGDDHQESLGFDLASIARNKWSALRPGETLIHLPLPPELRTAVHDFQRATGTRWIEAPPLRRRLERGTFEQDPKSEVVWEDRSFRSPLAGARGAENLGLALRAFRHLRPSDAASLTALEALHWPARFQRIAHPRLRLYVSGDHNPQGIESLAEIVSEHSYEKAVFWLGTKADKSRNEMESALRAVARAEIRHQHDWATVDPLRGLADFEKQLGPRDLLIVTGSLYWAGRFTDTGAVLGH